MGLFDQVKEPVFLKESSNIEKMLEQLKQIEPKLNDEGKKIIAQDIKYLEYGMIGEKYIQYELKHSHMPIYVLHDLYFEKEDKNAQIDYIVVTKKVCFFIECKNLYGDIEINSAGDFIRTMQFAGKKRKEGIYSPITQNQRHLALFKEMRLDRKNNRLIKFMMEKNFEENYKSIVVLANPKTVLNMKYAKKEVKSKVIRADQLIAYIKEEYKKSELLPSSEKQHLEWAQNILAMHTDACKDYTKRYDSYYLDSANPSDTTEEVKKDAVEKEEVRLEEDIDEHMNEHMNQESLLIELKAYRLQKSREEKIKPYYLYNDAQLAELVERMPKSVEELKTISGFGEVKAGKYGADLIQILDEYRVEL